jgi:proline utilization trans-activator
MAYTRPETWECTLTEAVAQESLDKMLSSVGVVQHFFDARALSDSLAVFCDDFQRHEDRWSLRYIEVLMVMAIGTLLQNPPNQTRPPGFEYFLEAHRKLPNLLVLNRAGSAAIEVLGLTAFYLQCIGEREDAWIHVSCPSSQSGHV